MKATRGIKTGFIKAAVGLGLLSVPLVGAKSSAAPKAAVSGGGAYSIDPSCYVPGRCQSFFMTDAIGSPQAPSSDWIPTADGNRPEQGILDQRNLEEWNAYFNQSLTLDDLSTLVYSLSGDEIDELKTLIENNDRSGAPKSSNAQAAYTALIGERVARDSAIRFLRYLSLAKRVEPLATRNRNRVWWEVRPPRPPEEVAAELEAANRMVNAAAEETSQPDTFIAERHHFQILRLLFYTSQYAQAQVYYEKHAGDFKTGNTVQFRSMELAAGAYYRDGQYGKANYLFSHIFDTFPPLRDAARRAFHPMEDADWKETLALARDDHEREVLWHLLGLYVDPGAAIDNIHAVNPRSAALPRLLVREIEAAERSWNAAESRGGRPNPDPDKAEKQESEYLRQSVERIRRIADQNATPRPYIWKLAAGHLLALSGDSATADRYVNDALRTIPADAAPSESEPIRKQARMTLLFTRVRDLKSVDRQVEPFLARELQWLRQDAYDMKYLRNWIAAHLGEIYSRSPVPADHVRAQLLQDRSQGKIYESVEGIDSILAFFQKPESEFDRTLIRQYSEHHPVEHLQKLRGIHLTYAGDFAGARDAFGQTVNQALVADTFVIHIHDCLHCDMEAPHAPLTRTAFVQRLESLAAAASGQDETAARANFQIANALYNVSIYGNNRTVFAKVLLDEWDDQWQFRVYYPTYRPLPPSPTSEMNEVEERYLAAARLSSDREFKAQATFMAAKAEQNRRHSRQEPGNNEKPGAYFQTLKDTYSDTAYYREIVRECGYFRKYVQP